MVCCCGTPRLQGSAARRSWTRPALPSENAAVPRAVKRERPPGGPRGRASCPASWAVLKRGTHGRVPRALLRREAPLHLVTTGEGMMQAAGLECSDAYQATRGRWRRPPAELFVQKKPPKPKVASSARPPRTNSLNLHQRLRSLLDRVLVAIGSKLVQKGEQSWTGSPRDPGCLFLLPRLPSRRVSFPPRPSKWYHADGGLVWASPLSFLTLR